MNISRKGAKDRKDAKAGQMLRVRLCDPCRSVEVIEEVVGLI